MENKKTAMQELMEWMIEESQVIPVDAQETYNKAKELLAMEKEQQVQFYIKGCDDTYGCDEPNLNPDYDRKQAEQYYKETYGS